jgi:GNAT superfamily N-acetyltransferase
MEFEVCLAMSDEDLMLCFPVMRELRPQLDEAGFLVRVRRQEGMGYRVVFVRGASGVVAVAGYRVMENLSWGRFLFVDDLVTVSAHQGEGAGSALFDWLVAEARREGCAQVHLESGVQRFGAHRFYLHKGMDITCHHFALDLK